MLDFTGVGRFELKLALGAAIGIGVASFATSWHDGLIDSILFALAMAVIAGLTVVLFTAFE